MSVTFYRSSRLRGSGEGSIHHPETGRTNESEPSSDKDHKSGLLARALELANELSGGRPSGPESDAWAARAQHVGDMTVLALALDD